MVSTAAKEKKSVQQEHSVFPETVNRGVLTKLEFSERV